MWQQQAALLETLAAAPADPSVLTEQWDARVPLSMFGGRWARRPQLAELRIVDAQLRAVEGGEGVLGVDGWVRVAGCVPAGVGYS